MTKVIKFTAGVATGALVGMAIGALIDPISDKQKKALHKKSCHIFREIGNTIDSFADMF